MYLKEKLVMHHIAFELIQNGEYNILHINEDKGEIWLEKYKSRISNVIRLTNQGFDWKNELKRDISRTFQNTLSLGNLLIGKQVQIYNIYVSQFPPVDEWLVLKKPIHFKAQGRKEMDMSVYYVSQQDYIDEMNRISTEISPVSLIEHNEDEIVLESKLHQYNLYLHNSLIATKEKLQSTFTYGRPKFTYLLLAINILYFFILELNGDSTFVPDLLRFGAKYNPLIMDGDWWRIFSSMFLHIGFIHLFMNMLALYYLGTAVERIFGSMRFIFIYILAGIGGGIASFAFTINVSAGASGAIFGLFGALLFFGLKERKLFLQTMGRGILILIGFNIVFGFIAPQIDNSAHLGGLITGFLASAIVYLPNTKHRIKQGLAALVYLVLLTSLLSYGFLNGNNHAMYHLHKIDFLIEEGHFKEAINHADKGLNKKSNDELELNLYFQRSYAYIELGENELAISDLEKTIKINPQFEKSYYNLALLYYETGKVDLAEEAIEEAYRLNPSDEAYIKLYENIIGNTPK